MEIEIEKTVENEEYEQFLKKNTNVTGRSVGGWVGGSVGRSDFNFFDLLISQKLLNISR